ncbi:MAG: RidA family protein [Chitinophagales bacterium]|nr:RidA family protein [Chitinophagales bacterium]
MRQNFSSGIVWEKTISYSRAVRIGNVIKVAGTTAADSSGNIVGKNDVYAQCMYIYSKIKKILEEAGCGMDMVVSTRVYLVNINEWEAAGRAHHEIFAGINPVSTMIGINALIHPDLLVEIEVEAMVHY